MSAPARPVLVTCWRCGGLYEVGTYELHMTTPRHWAALWAAIRGSVA